MLPQGPSSSNTVHINLHLPMQKSELSHCKCFPNDQQSDKSLRRGETRVRSGLVRSLTLTHLVRTPVRPEPGHRGGRGGGGERDHGGSGSISMAAGGEASCCS